MFLGMCAWLSYDYKIISNRETGKGRADIILESLADKPSYVMEFKYTKDKEKLDTLAKEAIQQIKAQQYDISLKGQVICRDSSLW
ncbi:PD-(D/E)XK nuclease domain-containing protein [Allocoprobacillus halotolerans]|uniref:PD-(D/E)XK nuclease domain-containing protein n=1 Tax=Allocoprobacillus halotolerans TaxID=2944914 RepID=A0ABY5I1S0_9FIRM|nr:PD-(D/E)XK nuclease domain-containing protein [Allocoprobacillus halotolerans]UTY38056.1 PD-(D/E)XK nuclease domain-containing protein [Allocoprobacillus halotolerans]